MTPQHLALGASQGSQQIRSVQALRAIAALFVVTYHSTILWRDKSPLESVGAWDNGNSGVDLFFVISGFIMMVSSQRLRRQQDGWLKFIRLRLVRLVPLYWLATAVKLAVVLAVPAVALHTYPNAWNAVASLLFLPSVDATGAVIPVLGVGWTLSFEMLFYAAFAAALYLSLNPLAVVTPAMIGLAALSVAKQAYWPAAATLADPIVLEFVFGLLIGHLALAGDLRQTHKSLAILVGIAGLAIMILMPTHDRWERVLIWGVAAAATLWAALAVETWAGPRHSETADQHRGSILLPISHAWLRAAGHGSRHRQCAPATARHRPGARPSVPGCQHRLFSAGLPVCRDADDQLASSIVQWPATQQPRHAAGTNLIPQHSPPLLPGSPPAYPGQD